MKGNRGLKSRVMSLRGWRREWLPQQLVVSRWLINFNLKVNRKTSLMVQGLRLLFPTQGARDGSLVRDVDPTCCN